MRDHGGNLDAAMARYGGTRRRVARPVDRDQPAAVSAAGDPGAGMDGAAHGGRACGAGRGGGARLWQHGAGGAGRRGAGGDSDCAANGYGASRTCAGAHVQRARGGADGGGLVRRGCRRDGGAGRRGPRASWSTRTTRTGGGIAPADLRALAAGVGLLVVDESFADPEPELSLAGALPDNALILRSFGKFYGLAGLRLGFVLAGPRLADRVRELAGPGRCRDRR